MKPEIRPTGIIRTLPSLYGDSSVGAKRFHASIKAVEKGKLDSFLIALQAIPKYDVLHLYLLIEGEIVVRANIADYIPGYEAECWDKTWRQPKVWAVCTAPISRPPEKIKMRGFQGFRYVEEELW